MIRLVSLLMLLAGQAQALSCMRPDVAWTFEQADEAEELYSIMRGSLSFDESLMPQGYDESAGTPDKIPAEFSGHFLTQNGFDKPVETPITLAPTCAGPWCGSAAQSDDVIVFVEYVADGFELEVGACPFFMFYNPTPDMERTLVSCAKGGPCKGAN